MTDALKGCPFCGRPGELKFDSGSYGYIPSSVRVVCSDWRGCGTVGRRFEAEHWEQGKGTTFDRPGAERQAVEFWNRRFP